MQPVDGLDGFGSIFLQICSFVSVAGDAALANCNIVAAQNNATIRTQHLLID